MATTLYALNSYAPAGSPTVGTRTSLALSTSPGGSGVDGFTTTIWAAQNHFEAYNAISGIGIWLYRVNAVTISGSVGLYMAGYENAMATNVGPAIRIVRVLNDGTIASDVVADANANHASGTEFGVGSANRARQNWTATPTSTSFSAGDWIGVIFHFDAVGTTSNGQANLSFVGADGDAYDSHVVFTETITAYSPSSLGPIRRVHQQAVARSTDY